MVKKILSIAAVVLIVTSAAVCAGQKYNLEDLYLSVEAPQDWVVMTRNAGDNNEAVQLFGVNSANIISFLESSRIYADFVKKDATAEIFINMIEEDDEEVISINGFSDEALDEFANQLMGLSIDEIVENADEMSYEGYLADDIEWLGYEVYHHDQVVFLKIYSNKTINDIVVPSVQYSTLQNGQSINISLSSYNGPLTDEMEMQIKNVVDSIQFTKIEKGKVIRDWYTITKNIMVTICIIGIVFGGIFIIRNRKSDNNNNVPPAPPTHKATSTHSGTLD